MREKKKHTRRQRSLQLWISYFNYKTMNKNLEQLIQQRLDIARQMSELSKERKRLNNAICQARHREKVKK